MRYSILISTFNDEKYIEQTINSVININYNHYEIIVYDDCSTDSTSKILRKIPKRKNIEIIIGNENKGVSIARNTLIDRAHGEYFIFLDGDDTLNNDIFIELDKIIDNEKPDLVHYNITEILFNGQHSFKDGCDFTNLKGEDAFKIIFNDHYNISESPCTYAIKREYYITTHYQFLKNTVHEDFRIIPLLLIKANCVASIDFNGYNYIRRKNSITTSDSEAKLLSRTNDMINHYYFQISEMSNFVFVNNYNKKIFYNFISNSVIQAVSKIKPYQRKKILNKQLKKKIICNLYPSNINEAIRKFILSINFNLYIYIFYTRRS